jgi:hypothetical protein
VLKIEELIMANGRTPFTPVPDSADRHDQQVLDWTDLGREMWSFLTGRNAAINYRFIDMHVEVPRDTGPQAPRATWRLNGTLQVTTSDARTAAAADSSLDRVG